MDDRDEARPATGTATTLPAAGAVEVSAVAADLRLVVVQLLRRLREQAPGSDLTKSQSTVLGLLETLGSATATELAKAQGMRPQSMAAIVAALQPLGLVAGAPDPRDGRKTVLRLTEKAREEFRTGRLAKEDWLTSALVATLTPEQIAQVAEVVPLLRRLGQA